MLSTQSPRTGLRLVALLALLPAGGGAATANARPNVLLITSEDHGPDIGCYGETRIQTPHLDRLAAEGVLFERAYVSYSVCSPSRATILTGLYAHQHGQVGLATHKYAMYQHWPNVASLLKQAGYRTGIIGKLHVNPSAAFPFDFQALSGSNFADRPMRKFTQKAGEFLGSVETPFFLMVNFPDAHFPLLSQQYGLPRHPLTGDTIEGTLPFLGIDTPRLRQHVADYLNCLRRLDDGVGLLLKELRRAGGDQNTLIIYLSDHGAQFSRGKTTCYEAGLRVPLIMRWAAESRGGLRLPQLVSSVDVLPTILDACGINAPSNLPGMSLFAFLRNPQSPGRRYLCTGKAGSTPFWTFPQRSIRDDRWKLIWNLASRETSSTAVAYREHHNQFFVAGCEGQEIADAPATVRNAYETWENPPEFELYDLLKDPFEFQNLADAVACRGQQERLLEALRAWQRETDDPFGETEKLRRYLDEMRAVSAHYGARAARYRKDPDFQWNYPSYLARQRAP